VFSRVYIAEEADGVRDKGSGDTTTVDVWTLMDFLDMSLRSACFTDKVFFVVKSKTSSVGTALRKCQNVWIFKTSVTGLTLSNPIFLPTAYSPALIYCGRERGWWITCSLKSVLHEEKCRTSPDIGAERKNRNVGQVRCRLRKG